MKSFLFMALRASHDGIVADAVVREDHGRTSL